MQSKPNLPGCPGEYEKKDRASNGGPKGLKSVFFFGKNVDKQRTGLNGDLEKL